MSGNVISKCKVRKLYDRVASDYVEAVKKGRSEAAGKFLELLTALDIDMAPDEIRS